jgi:regulator of ribonuclease activity B
MRHSHSKLQTMLSIIAVLVIAAGVLLVFNSRRSSGMKRVADGKGVIGSLEGDQQVLAELKKAGGDLSKPTEVNYYLYFQNKSAAESASALAGAGPLVATVRRAANDSAWLCYVSGTMIPSEAAIHAHTVRLVEIARKYGGEYDGWEAALAK